MGGGRDGTTVGKMPSCAEGMPDGVFIRGDSAPAGSLREVGDAPTRNGAGFRRRRNPNGTPGLTAATDSP